ncbi:MAG TPA: hypothetical protein VFS08_09330 [Gemmatimonadaceae bacterium]|nr:hypothetical protein [Gemmatimonadaceae bacterium]
MMTDRERARERDVEKEIELDEQDPMGGRPVEPNPSHTSKDHITAPKFGSAGSGGAELEPGPPRP